MGIFLARFAKPYESFATLTFAFRADAVTFQEVNIHAAGRLREPASE